MSGLLAGKVALVTGAGAGIGRASALAFATVGAQVVVADIDIVGGEETAQAIEHAGGEALFVKVDVTDADQVNALVAQAVARFGRLDCAHNNAGILGTIAPILESPDENFDQVMAVNLKGVWLCLKAEIRQMLTQGGGAIVNTASSAGIKGSATLPAYSASKHAVVGLTKSVALAYARDGIRVNAVCPGYVDTELLDRLFAGEPERKESERIGTLIGRFGTATEIAQTVVWLCSDSASLMTAHALPVGTIA
ncbi:MAG TPA: glucose 1-dehydrogenase [Chloroflexota bacterium]|nr:glucose 1-dehydrogenase [Chloroflexota bacterium]